MWGMIAGMGAAMLGGSMLSHLGRPNIPAPPNFEDVMDLFDEISGTSSQIVTGPDGKKRRVITSIPRSPEEEAVYGMLKNNMYLSLKNHNELAGLAPDLYGASYNDLARAFGKIKEAKPEAYDSMFKDIQDFDNLVQLGQRASEGLGRAYESAVPDMWTEKRGKRRGVFREGEYNTNRERLANLKNSVTNITGRMQELVQEMRSDPAKSGQIIPELKSLADQYKQARKFVADAVKGGPRGGKKGHAASETKWARDRAAEIAELNEFTHGMDQFVKSVEKYGDNVKDSLDRLTYDIHREQSEREFAPVDEAFERVQRERTEDLNKILTEQVDDLNKILADMPDINKYTREYEDFQVGNIERAYGRAGEAQQGTLHSMGYGAGSTASLGAQAALERRKARDLEQARLQAPLIGQQQLGMYLANMGEQYGLKERAAVGQYALKERARSDFLGGAIGEYAAKRQKHLGDMGDVMGLYQMAQGGIGQRRAEQMAGGQSAAGLQNQQYNQMLQHYQAQLAQQQAQGPSFLQTLGTGISGLGGYAGGSFFDNYFAGKFNPRK